MTGLESTVSTPKNLSCPKTLQELRMLSSVTINCQVTKIVMNSGSRFSEPGLSFQSTFSKIVNIVQIVNMKIVKKLLKWSELPKIKIIRNCQDC